MTFNNENHNELLEQVRTMAHLQKFSYTQIASELNITYNKVYSIAKKHNISITDSRGGTRKGSGVRCDFKDTWTTFIHQTLFYPDGSLIPKKERGSIQVTLYETMCIRFEDDDFQNHVKPTTLGNICRKILNQNKI